MTATHRVNTMRWPHAVCTLPMRRCSSSLRGARQNLTVFCCLDGPCAAMGDADLQVDLRTSGTVSDAHRSSPCQNIRECSRRRCIHGVHQAHDEQLLASSGYLGPGGLDLRILHATPSPWPRRRKPHRRGHRTSLDICSGSRVGFLPPTPDVHGSNVRQCIQSARGRLRADCPRSGRNRQVAGSHGDCLTRCHFGDLPAFLAPLR